MQVYLYSKSGHTIGLDQTKRCAAIAHYLKDLNPILCTSDFRAGAYAKDLLGVSKYVNVDVLRNLHNMMNENDILFFETDETNENMINEMKEFCSLAIDLNEIKEPIVDRLTYKELEKKNLEQTIFFGDDDYDNEFLEMAKNSSQHNLSLLMGHYFFLGNEKIFSEHFNEVIDEEEYVETIQNSKYLLTSSLQSAFESISCGNYPVLLKRTDKTYDDELINEIGIPTIELSNLDDNIKEFTTITENYPKINMPDFFDISKLVEKIENLPKNL